MIFILGGAYQGKTTYALEKFGLKEENIYSFRHMYKEESTLDGECKKNDGDKEKVMSEDERTESLDMYNMYRLFSHMGTSDEGARFYFGDEKMRIVSGLEIFCRLCSDCGIEARDILEDSREMLEDKIIICRDESQGLVPMKPKDRAYREMLGRMMIYLAKEADEVYRVFAGLGQRIK